METVKPDLWIVGIDETEYWREDYRERCGKIGSFYLVDASVYTYICSFTPMLWLRYIDFTTAKQIDDELYDEVLMSLCRSEQSDYYGLGVLNTKYKENVTKYHLEDFPGYDDPEAYDEWFNDIVEYYRGGQCDPFILTDWYFAEVEND